MDNTAMGLGGHPGQNRTPVASGSREEQAQLPGMGVAKGEKGGQS